MFEPDGLPLGSDPSVSKPSSSLLEFRRIRAEQDLEYAECLTIDQQKVAMNNLS